MGWLDGGGCKKVKSGKEEMEKKVTRKGREENKQHFQDAPEFSFINLPCHHYLFFVLYLMGFDATFDFNLSQHDECADLVVYNTTIVQ